MILNKRTKLGVTVAVAVLVGLTSGLAGMLVLVVAWLLIVCRHLSSTLANSYGVGERIRHAVPDMAWNFDSVSVRP